MRGRNSRYDDDYGFSPYVPVAERRRKAIKEMNKLRKKGHPVSPVVIDGVKIARTFWGRAWCDNLERYSDFSNRLPRGRTYVRNGSVVDLQVQPGRVMARVSGSELYEVAVSIAPVSANLWAGLCNDCGGAVDSLVELLQGRLSTGVMERLCRQDTGLFPSPAQIKMSCSCPDSATMCKHVAAVLYGIGARLDEQPELLFRLRQVDESALIASVGSGLSLAREVPVPGRVLEESDLSALFGVDMAVVDAPRVSRPRKKATPLQVPEPPVRSEVLHKDTAVRMLAGVYAGCSGVVSWVRQGIDKVTNTMSLQADRGKATTQVASSSFGTKRELVAPSPTSRVTRSPSRDAPQKARAKPSPQPATAMHTEVLAKGTAIRMLAGIYAGYSGWIASVLVRSDPHLDIKYTIALTGPDGRRARTTVKHSTRGRTWATE